MMTFTTEDDNGDFYYTSGYCNGSTTTPGNPSQTDKDFFAEALSVIKNALVYVGFNNHNENDVARFYYQMSTGGRGETYTDSYRGNVFLCKQDWETGSSGTVITTNTRYKKTEVIVRNLLMELRRYYCFFNDKCIAGPATETEPFKGILESRGNEENFKEVYSFFTMNGGNSDAYVFYDTDSCRYTNPDYTIHTSYLYDYFLLRAIVNGNVPIITI